MGQPSGPRGWLDHLRYGALGYPLAFVALPLYVILPAHYGDQLGVPLAALGLVLLASRLLDALADPLLGLWADSRLARASGPWAGMAVAAVVLAAGVWAVFFPPVEGTGPRLVWCAVTLTLTYWAYSACAIAHQAWGARMGGDAPARARWVAWREGLALAGVLTANGIATTLGPAVMAATLSVSLVVALALLRRAPRPPLGGPGHVPGPPAVMRFTWAEWLSPLRNPEFRRLLGIFLINGIANAVPATLVMFYVQDVLHQAEALPVFLGAYFLTGAISVPLWLRAVKRLGPSRAWVLGMAGYVLCFGPVITLQAGDATAYTLICLASGLMLGADLTLPSTLLAGVVQRQALAAQHAPGAAGPVAPQEGIYTGWWQLATKLNLALAAGLALPALQLWGYTPGTQAPEALWHLTLVYGALPCALKLLAGLAWWRWWARAGLE